MTRFSKIGTAALLTLWFAGMGASPISCGKADSSDSGTTTGSDSSSTGDENNGGGSSAPVVPSNPAVMYGHTFTTACNSYSGYSNDYQISIYNDGSLLTFIERNYNNGSCNSSGLYMAVSTVAVINSVGSIDSTNGRIDVNFTPADTYITPTSSWGVSTLNGQNGGQGFCHYTPWVLNTGVDAQTISCNKMPSGWTSGSMHYVSLFLTGSAGAYTLTMDAASDYQSSCWNSLLNGTASNKRCTTAGTSTYDDIFTFTQ